MNGVPARTGQKVEAGRDLVEVDGVPVETNRKVYVVLNKPAGVVTSVRDPHFRRTVLDCVDGVRGRLFPIGRLDKDVTGTLLLTNDGELTHRLSHPKFEIEKVYLARVRGEMTPETAKRIESGVELEDGPAAADAVTIVRASKNSSVIRLRLHEGRKRLVKRLCSAVGHPVKELRRLSMAQIRTDDLQPGEWRYLSADEVAELMRLTGLIDRDN